MVRVARVGALRGSSGRGGPIGVEVWPKNRPKGFRWSIMEVLGLFPHAILAGIAKTTFDTTLAWTLIAYVLLVKQS